MSLSERLLSVYVSFREIVCSLREHVKGYLLFILALQVFYHSEFLRISVKCYLLSILALQVFCYSEFLRIFYPFAFILTPGGGYCICITPRSIKLLAPMIIICVCYNLMMGDPCIMLGH